MNVNQLGNKIYLNVTLGLLQGQALKNKHLDNNTKS